MRSECNIIRDLLPLYVENMISSDTSDFVEEHLKSCEACRKEYERTKEPQSARKISDATPLLKLSRKMKVKKIQTIALTAILMIALFVSAFAVLDAPIYSPYSEGLVTLEQLGDKGMLLTFDEEVTDFDYTVYEAPDGGNLYYCDIQAWTSLWDKWFSQGKRKLSATITTRNAAPIIAVYVPNDGSENVCIAKYDPNADNRIDKNVEYKNTTTLPRLSLGYYLILAAAALAALGIVWFLTRKKAELRIWVERIALYPAAYIISHCIVSGINWTSYSLPRDFSLIVFISILLYSGLLLTHNIWYLKREIKEINH
ncbi:MAG: zf-HC2 domain-containing protein [Lachnospiraceae bacterium]|nr:zf-HC2 domain-containing protein [Lachnospiraceae bacterium]